MSLEFCSIASGSSGNCYLVKSGGTALLVDAGISGRRILEGLDAAGVSPEEVSGIFVTHEHSDHIRSIRIAAKKMPNAMIYCNLATWEFIRELVPEERFRVFAGGSTLPLGEIQVRSFPICHDAADPVGYSFFSGGRQASILTDTGCITEEIFGEIKDADLIALEANHDKDVLQFCRYPYHIKRRILSDEGHLSNEAAGECILRLASEHSKKRKILLSHLSKENNTPEIAMVTIQNMLEGAGIYPGTELVLDVVTRSEISRVYRLEEGK